MYRRVFLSGERRRSGCNGFVRGEKHLARVGQLSRSFIYCLLCRVNRSGCTGPGTRPLPGPVPGECGAVTAPPRDRASGLRPAFPAGARDSAGRARAGSDWREPGPSARRFLISSVRIGKKKKKKKAGKPDLTLQLSAPGEWKKTFPRIWRAGECV